MGELSVFEQRRQLSLTMAALSETRSVDALVQVLVRGARAVAASDGAAVIRREGDKVAYIAEDAVKPLWKGRRFAIEACISGLAITSSKAVIIPDIFADERVPHAAYRPTFVRSLAMYPIGLIEPRMAVGAYWRDTGSVDGGTGALLATLARFAGVTLGRLACANAA